MSGKSAQEIAAELGIGVTTVFQKLKAVGVEPQLRRLSPELVDRAVALYLAGRPTQVVAAELGIGLSTLCRKLKARGIEVRGARKRTPDAAIVQEYLAGATELALSKKYSLDRNSIRLRLEEAGVPIRGISEALRAYHARVTPAERRTKVQPAHEGRRRRPITEEGYERRARTREANPAPMSNHEAQFAAWLSERNVAYVREKAVGRYSVDFAVGSIAVEILGGNWHSRASKRSRHDRRTPYILDKGWNILFVWAASNYPMTSAVADYLVAFIDEMSRNPPAVRQYRVVRGDGQLLAGGGPDDYKNSGIPAPGERTHALCRNPSTCRHAPVVDR